MLKQVQPKNARSKRALEKKAPQVNEHARMTLFLRYTTTSEVVQMCMRDIQLLKKPLCLQFNKKNNIHPFEDPSSLEFFSEKNDASLMVFGSHSKKRPNCITLVRTFEHKILDMLELYIDPETMKTLSQFKNAKAAVGLKPMISFSGAAFDSPTENAYTVAKSLLLELFKGPDTNNVDAEGLQYMIHISAGEELEGVRGPKIYFRSYLIKTKKSGQSLPRVEIEEMGPRIDFRIGRLQQADESIMKEAMKKPKSLEPKQKKNIETDIIGDKVGRIHVGKQDIAAMQTRKMKGLKRSRGDDDDVMLSDDEEGGANIKMARV